MGITTVFVTHDQDEALLMSDRVVVMNGGNSNITGGAVRLFFRPEDVVVDCLDNSQDKGLTLNGKVHAVYFQGASTMAEVRVPGLQYMVLFDVSNLVRRRALSDEEDISLFVPGSKIHVFSHQ